MQIQKQTVIMKLTRNDINDGKISQMKINRAWYFSPIAIMKKPLDEECKKIECLSTFLYDGLPTYFVPV